MARHGENIRKRKDGRWEGRFAVYSKAKEKKVYRSVYGKTYNEVREKLVLHKNLSENSLSETSLTQAEKIINLCDMAEEWLKNIKCSRKTSTYVKYYAIYHNHIKQLFDNTVISEITETSVREKISDHLSDSISKSIYCVLNQILKYTSKKYCISTPNLKKSESVIQNRPVQTLSQGEQKKLISVLYKDVTIFKTSVLLCLFTGLRLGEVCALKWSDIDFENKIFTVNRTVQRLPANGRHTKTALIETVPKSECSKREIPLSDIAFKLLQGNCNRKEYVFGDYKPMEPRTLQYHFKKILNEANLEDKNFHILRHTFATNCIERGIDVKSLSEILGHSDVQITLNRYVHPSMDTKRRYMDKLSKFYGQFYGHAG